MKTRNLIHQSIIHYARYYRLVAVAVVITVAVIVGSLMIGDSVRATLKNRVAERLGATETIVTCGESFLSDKILTTPLFSQSSRGMLITNGFVSRNGKFIPVKVWGIDYKTIGESEAMINRSLRNELKLADNEDIVLRLPKTSLVPSGSLFVTDNYTTSLRLSFGGIMEVDEGGNYNLKNEQTIPLNIFLNRATLADALDVEGKINLILSSKTITDSEFNHNWNHTHSGLTINLIQDYSEIVSDRVFIADQVSATICKSNEPSNRLFSYLANTVAFNNKSIPYSFITAAENYGGRKLNNNEIILSDYSANRLGAKIGDSIEVSYFTLKQFKSLITKSIKLRVERIVPLSEFTADSTLSANFPGLTDVDRCTDWDSDLPIDMSLITDDDEKYWEQYRNAPKAIIAYSAIAADWSSPYGNATGIRLANKEPNLSQLNAQMFGIQLIHPREAGLYAALNGVDFAGLSLALGCFIIFAALLLMLNPLSEMYQKREREIQLLKALGYSNKRVGQLLFKESAPIIMLSSLAGLIAGILYTYLIMWLLGNVWKGATHTEGFSVYPEVASVGIGFAVSIFITIIVSKYAISSALKQKTGTTSESVSLKRMKLTTIASLAITVILLIINLLSLNSVILFSIVGAFLIVTGASLGNYIVCLKRTSRTNTMDSSTLAWASLFASRRQSTLSFFALAAGIFIVFAVGLNRRGFTDSSKLRSGTGGYSFWCESSVPIYYDLSTPDGRKKLSLSNLPHNTKVLQCLRNDGDDASCLNLNKVSSPAVLGVDMNMLASSDFKIEQSLEHTTREKFFEQMQQKNNDVYPALVDATVLTWGIMGQIGDTLHYKGDGDKDIAIRIVGTLSNSVFQGNILIDRKLFSEIWSRITGSELILLKVADDEKEATANLISQALNEYGVRITTTNMRLKEFNTVTDTYLTIFMTLGCLGLLLGIMSFVIVVRKNLAMRHREIDLYQTLGFKNKKIEQLLFRENIMVPLYAIAVGVISSLVSVSLNFFNSRISVLLMALIFTVIFVWLVISFVRITVRGEINKTV